MMGKAIAISRDFGCGGLELARALAQELGYAYLDKALIVELAQKLRTSEGEISSFEDGKSLGLFNFVSKYMTSAMVKGILGDDFGYVDLQNYRLALEGLMNDLADRGDVVIVGRGGQCILQNRSDVLRVGVIASVDYRRRFIANKQGITEEEAQYIISVRDHEQKKYHEVMFSRDNDDATLYHVIINLEQVDQDSAATVIKALL